MTKVKGTFRDVNVKAEEIQRVSDLDKAKAKANALIANRTNKSELVRIMIFDSGALGISKVDLQIVTGWNLHNLHSILRESFCDKYGIHYNKKTGRFSA
jgi:hypothetical protein